MSELPILSLAALSCGGATADAETERLLAACETHGFFYVRDHGIDDAMIADVISTAHSFFAMPAAIKERFGHAAQHVVPAGSRGYVPLYGETLHSVSGPDSKEVFDLGLESDDTGPFRGRTVLPDEEVVPGFARALLALQRAVVVRIVPGLGRALARALGLGEDWFDTHFAAPTLLQRVIRYPSAGGAAGKHTDNGFFTILLQEVLDTPSLRVFLDGRWTPVPSLPGTFVVNLGDMLQTMSAGRFVSTPHEVAHAGAGERISLPFFVYPALDAVLIAPGTSERIDVEAVMLANFASIWEAGTGAGRARELA